MTAKNAIITKQDVIDCIHADEPDYFRPVKLEFEAVQYIGHILTGGQTNEMQQANAIYVAAQDRGGSKHWSHKFLLIAAHSPSPIVRLAAAVAVISIENFEVRKHVIADLVADSDESVSSYALKSAKKVACPKPRTYPSLGKIH